VFLHSEGTTATGLDSDDAFLFLDYYWTFDDPTSGYWTTGALAKTSTPQPKNVEYGPTAGHLFEEPGNYTVRLTVCNTAGNDCDTDAQLIRVADPDTVYAGNATVCVNHPRPTPGVDGCPSGAKVYDSLDFDDLWNNAAGCNLDETASHTRCLLRRGKTYVAGSTKHLYSSAGNQIGAYGASGNKPVIRGGSFNLFDDHGAWSDWTFYDVKLYSPSGSTQAARFATWHSHPVHFALIRVEAEGWSRVIQALRDPGGHNDHGGFYLYEVSRTVATPGMSYAMYGGFRDLWIAGVTLGDLSNNDDPGDIEQHFFRLTDVQRGFIGHNLINQGGGNSESTTKMHNSHKSRDTGLPPTHSVVVADNEAWHGGSDGWKWTIGVGSGSGSGAGALVRRFVFERNWYHSDGYDGTHQLGTRAFHMGNTEKIMIRNNILDCSAQDSSVHNSCYLAKVDDREGSDPDPEDTYIFNNTTAHFGRETSQIGIANLSSTINTDARANLLYVGGPAPNSELWNQQTPAVNIDNLDSRSDPFVDGKIGMTPEDFRLASPDNVTPVTGVRRDFSGAIRTGGHARGAWSSNGADAPPPQLIPSAPTLMPPQ
jgi:hypothetical protein